MKEYFKISARQNQQLAEVHGPQDANGEYFPERGPIEPGVHGVCRCVDRRKQLADCVYCVTRLIISERATEVIKRFRLPEGMCFLPVDVVGKDGHSLGPMVVVVFPEILEVVDLQASKFEKLPSGFPWYFTEPPIIESSKTSGFDLFRGFHVKYVCSGALRSELLKEELTGFDFKQLTVR